MSKKPPPELIQGATKGGGAPPLGHNTDDPSRQAIDLVSSFFVFY